jgi:hypothetical protein
MPCTHTSKYSRLGVSQTMKSSGAKDATTLNSKKQLLQHLLEQTQTSHLPPSNYWSAFPHRCSVQTPADSTPLVSASGLFSPLQSPISYSQSRSIFHPTLLTHIRDSRPHTSHLTLPSPYPHPTCPIMISLQAVLLYRQKPHSLRASTSTSK